MNIYITPQNETKLRKESSMSGLINKLLDSHYSHEHKHVPIPKKKLLTPAENLKNAQKVFPKAKDITDEYAPAPKPEPITYKPMNF